MRCGCGNRTHSTLPLVLRLLSSGAEATAITTPIAEACAATQARGLNALLLKNCGDCALRSMQSLAREQK